MLLFAALLAPGPSAAVELLSCPGRATQESVERAAFALLQDPVVRQARREAAARWQAAAGPVSAEAAALFAPAMDELAYASALEAVALAADPPALIRLANQPHAVGDLLVPGSRFGWDNPDFLYGLIPVDPGSTYVLRGRLPHPGQEINLSAWEPDGTVVANLALSDIAPAADGSFEITVGTAPGAARNHIAINARTDRIFVRQTLADWRRDQPVALAVTRTEGGAAPASGLPARPPAERAAAQIRARVANMIRWRPMLYLPLGLNVIGLPRYPTEKQGQPGQAYAMGSFALADDEALVIDVGLGGAAYFTMPVTSVWGITADYGRDLVSINSAQVERNADGTLTLVVAPRDPGLFNWVSTAGRHEGDLTLRWQKPAHAPGLPGGPWARARLVKLADLPKAVPALRRVTAEERARQLAARADYPARQWDKAICR
jgi:hypothetical protein